MAERIQLKDPGSELRLFVNTVKPETVERNDYYLFSDDHKEMLVPQSSVKAQMERLSIANVEQMIGRWVRFGRSTKMSRANKPFWDIDWTSPPERNGSGTEAPSQSAIDRAHGVEFRVPISSAGGEMGKPTAGTPSAPPSAEPPADTDDAKKLARGVYATRMKQATKYVIDEIEPILKTKGIGMSDDGVYKFAFSLWTEWSHRGIIQ